MSADMGRRGKWTPRYFGRRQVRIRAGFDGVEASDVRVCVNYTLNGCFQQHFADVGSRSWVGFRSSGLCPRQPGRLFQADNALLVVGDLGVVAADVLEGAEDVMLEILEPHEDPLLD